MKVPSDDNVSDNDSADQKYNSNLLKQQRNNNTRASNSKISVDTNRWTWNGNDEEDLGLVLLFSNTVTKENHLSTNGSTILPSLSANMRLSLLEEEKEKKALAATREENEEQGGNFEEMFSGDFAVFQCEEEHITEIKDSPAAGYRENHDEELDREFRRNIIRQFLEMVEREERSLSS